MKKGTISILLASLLLALFPVASPEANWNGKTYLREYLDVIRNDFVPSQEQLNSWEDKRIEQQIEITMQEVSLLRSLLSGMEKEGGPDSSYYLVSNIENDSVILESNANKSRPIASITKLMTAVVAREHLEKHDTITLTPQMLSTYGQTPVLFEGLEIRSEELLKASLIQSVNDAANALSHFNGKERFVSLMNTKAKELEMHNTSFSDSHGLNIENRSTARDLMKLASYVHEEHPDLLEISRNNDFWLPDRTGRDLKFKNTNNFYPISSYLGGKNGYLPQAGETSLALFEVQGKTVGITLLGSEDRKADIFSLLDRTAEKL